MVIYAPDGEKWACEACLKGHRVTSCSHRGPSQTLRTIEFQVLTLSLQTDNYFTSIRKAAQCRNVSIVEVFANLVTAMSSAYAPSMGSIRRIIPELLFLVRVSLPRFL